MTLVQVAREDEEVRGDLLKLLRLESFQRKSVLGSTIANMELKGAPPEFLRPVAYLRDDP